MNTIWPLLCLACFGHFVVDCMVSIFPVYKTMAGLDVGVAGMLAAIAVLIGEASQLFCGKYIDRGWGKIFLVTGIALVAAAAFYPYVGGMGGLFCLLLLTFLGSAAFHPAAVSVLGATSYGNKALLMGCFSTFGMMGMGVGQLLFAWATFWVGGQTGVLAIMSILVVGCGLFWWKRVRVAPVEEHEHISMRLFVRFFKARPLRYLYFVQLADQILLWSTAFILPDFLASRGYPQDVVYGQGMFFYMLGAAVASIPSGWFSAHIAPGKLIVASFVGAIACLSALLGWPAESLPALFLSLFGFGAALGAIPPLVLALGNELVPSHRGMVSAFLMGLVWIIAEVCGVGLIGMVADCFEGDAPAKALACFGTLLFGGAWFAIRYMAVPHEAVVVRDQ